MLYFAAEAKVTNRPKHDSRQEHVQISIKQKNLVAAAESKIHHAVIGFVAKHGYAPTISSLSEQLGWSANDCRTALTRLSEVRGVILKPNSFDVWAIHPFTLMPTPTWVTSEGHAWWANCAWCALGIGATLGQDIRASSRLGAHDEPTEFEIRSGESTNPRLIIHFPFRPGEWWDNPYNPCGCILFFSSEDQIDSWCKCHHIPKGETIDISTGTALARECFSDYMKPSWRRKTRDEALQIFRALGLTSDFWASH